MPDPVYQTANLILKSRGVMARYAVDAPPGESFYLNEDNLEEIEDNALASRLGTVIVNKVGPTAFPLGASDAVHSLSKLPSLSGSDWRYAGVDDKLYRLAGTAPGAYQLIASQLSAQPWTSATFNSPASSLPYLFIADASRMLKDNGYLSAPQNNGILQPQYPVEAQAQEPDEIVLDAYQLSSSYATSGFTSFSQDQSLTVAQLASAVVVPGIQSVNISTAATVYTTGGELTTLTESTPGNYTQSSSTTSAFPSVPIASSDVVNFSTTVQASGTILGTGGVSVAWYYSINGGATWIAFYGYGFGASGTLAPTVVNGTASGMTNLSQLVFKCALTLGVPPGSTVGATCSFGAVSAGIIYLTGNPISLYQSLVVDSGGSQETVLVLQVTPTGFAADFVKAHAVGVNITEYFVEGTIAASTTAIMSSSFNGTPIALWPTTLEQEDYIGVLVFVGDPNAIESITLQFNTQNGGYFYRTIGQGPLQSSLNPSTDSSTAAADAVLSNTLGLYTSGTGGITALNTVAGWTPILLQLSGFAGAGGADFNDPVANWKNVTGYQVTIVTGIGLSSTQFPVLFEMSSLLLVGGSGPDSFAGVSYDYLVTLFNINDYTESNPCMVMTDVNPPVLTNRVLPRRQPVLLSWINSNVDTQATHWRVFRRGGTLGDNYRRIDQILITAMTGGTQTYTDIWSDLDIQQSDTVSFVNDVPVTSTLPVPVNTTLVNAIGVSGVAVNSVQTVTPASMANISTKQQVDLGNVIASNFETVIVLSITATTFSAYVQNYHAAGEPVAATAAYAQPLDIIAVANDIGYYAGDPFNPSYLYISAKGNIQYVSSASYLPVSVPSDAITAIVASSGNIFIGTIMRWWGLAPGAGVNGSSTVYPLRVDHGVVGKNAWVLRDGVVYYMGLDGLRTFVGGNGDYISEVIEFVWQNTGPTPLPIADPTYFYNVRASTWNRWVFFSYRALDGKTYRIILDCTNKRYRNDSLDAQSMFLEADTNTLVWGDSRGLVHLDRQLVSYDESVANISDVVHNPIAIELQTPYNNMGSPAETKQWNELTIDANTNGFPVTAELLFDDGETSDIIGTITTTQRQRVNLNLNNGLGYTGYKASLILTGAGTQRINLYQAALRYCVLAKTRQSLDTYWRKFSRDESKIARFVYIEYTAQAPITMNVYYDGSSTPAPTFPRTLPQYSGVRNSLKITLPAVKFRLLRMTLTSTADFQVWDDSNFFVKPVCQGRGYESFPLIAVET